VPGLFNKERFQYQTDKMLTNQLVVIGAGPAGIMASLRAAELGIKVLLVERTGSIANKIVIAGGGRCNLTNMRDVNDFITFYHNGDFLRNAFAQFFNHDLVDFFKQRGLALVEERGQRVFPESQSGRDVALFLRRCLDKAKVQLWLRNRITEIKKENEEFAILMRTGSIPAKRVIIATGGKSYPQTGSTGDGYNLARKLGHTIIKPLPALCGMHLVEKWARKWQGVSLENVSVSVFLENEKIAEEFGEVVFTDYGISGPVIFNLSHAVTGIRGQMTLTIDFKPSLSREKLDARLLREFSTHSNMRLKNILKNLLPAAIIEHFIGNIGLDGEKTANQITAGQRQHLLESLKRFTLTVEKLRDISEAIVTRGGVDVKEINPKTMESKIVPGLFFAGEIIDVDGKTGGFNLQAAFSTGFVAGSHSM
jgi:predicted Rossmann fold flavoprotein